MKPPKWLPPASMLPGKIVGAPASPRGSLRSASGSDPDLFYFILSILFFSVILVACGNSWARDQTYPTVVTQTTAVTTLDP